MTLSTTPAVATDAPPAALRGFVLSEDRAPGPAEPFIDRDGEKRTLSDYRGKLVLINFWATWCAPCVREMPSLERLHVKLRDRGFAALALSSDRKGWDDIAPFAERLGLRHLPLFHDPRLAFARAAGTKGLPTTILYDREGREIGRLVGPAEWDAPEAVALIESYLGR